MMKDPSSSTPESEKASSKMKAKVYESNEESNSSEKEESDKNNDRSKFKKEEMPMFNGEDPDSWLFRANRYFHIHKLTDSKKMTVATINFDEPEEREKFIGWSNLKERLLVRFRSAREGSICSQFLRIGQETTVKEYRNLFDKLTASLSGQEDQVVEQTFLNGLLPWIKAKVEFSRPVDLAQMMQLAQLVENREIIHNEANIKGYA